MYWYHIKTNMASSSIFQYAQNIDSLGGSLNEFNPRYFKTQKIYEQNCGLHALNHIAQQEVFSREYLNSIEKKTLANQLSIYTYCDTMQFFKLKKWKK